MHATAKILHSESSPKNFKSVLNAITKMLLMVSGAFRLSMSWILQAAQPLVSVLQVFLTLSFRSGGSKSRTIPQAEVRVSP
jgi:hypothetical protein